MQSIAPLIASGLALLISGLSLYFSVLAPAKLALDAGQSFWVGYLVGGPFFVSLPLSFVNTGARTSTFLRVALLIQSPESREGYLLEPWCYERWEEPFSGNGRYIRESDPVPIALVGRQSLVKQVLFVSSSDRPDEFQLVKSGTYNLTLLGWSKNSIHPSVANSFSMVVSDDQVNALREQRTKGETNGIGLPQAAWRNWTAHHLTEVEVKALSKSSN